MHLCNMTQIQGSERWPEALLRFHLLSRDYGPIPQSLRSSLQPWGRAKLGRSLIEAEEEEEEEEDGTGYEAAGKCEEQNSTI